MKHELMAEYKSLKYLYSNTPKENIKAYIVLYNKKQEQMLWDMYIHKVNEAITFEEFKKRAYKNTEIKEYLSFERKKEITERVNKIKEKFNKNRSC